MIDGAHKRTSQLVHLRLELSQLTCSFDQQSQLEKLQKSSPTSARNHKGEWLTIYFQWRYSPGTYRSYVYCICCFANFLFVYPLFLSHQSCHYPLLIGRRGNKSAFIKLDSPASRLIDFRRFDRIPDRTCRETLLHLVACPNEPISCQTIAMQWDCIVSLKTSRWVTMPFKSKPAASLRQMSSREKYLSMHEISWLVTVNCTSLELKKYRNSANF